MIDAPSRPSRRRFVQITAAAAGVAAWPFAATAMEAEAPFVWRGTALGAAARMQLHHPDPAAVRQAVTRALREVHRLELIFSLYRPDSALTRLNRQGALEAPPRELVALLEQCREIHALSGGAFDPSVQPLWMLHADHFAASGVRQGPPPPAVAAALERVGFQHVLVSRDRIAFSRRGMALTLNGIAQGYITDCVVAALRQAGFDRSLVDMGEARAIGPRPDGSPWQVGIADPEAPSRVDRTLAVVDQAVATSGGYGFRFDEGGRFNHLFDPRSGRSAERYRSVTTVMPTASAADALSTAFSLMPVDQIDAALKRLGRGSAHLIAADGAKRELRG